jgi:acetyl esterase
MSSTSAAEPLIEPQTQAWLDSVADEEGPPIYDLAPAAARQVLRHAQADAPVDLAPAQIEDRTIDGGPTGSVELRIYRPEGATGPLPLVLHTHGGGWILGDKDTHERLDRELTGLTGAMIVFVDYTPAPDAQYPVQNEQAYTALLWAVDHAGEIGADAGRFALLGDSVGGNMAAALTLMLKERGGPQPEAQVLFYPVTDHGLDTGSYRAFADGPWLTRRAMTWFWDAYLPDVAARDAPTVSPLRGSLDELSDLPPALVITAANDVLRDEGEAYARRLEEAGNTVTPVRYGGTIHDFVLLNPIAETPAPRAAIPQAAGFLRRAFGTA